MASFLKVTFLGSKNTSSTPFTPEASIPPLTDRVILITGGAGDLGRQTAISLALHGSPSHIIIADLPRPASEQATALSALSSALPPNHPTKLSYLDLDLSSLDAVQSASSALKELTTRLDILILNAGIMPVKPGTTKDGYEVAFGVNYLGHVLLTRLVVGMMVETLREFGGEGGQGGRVVVVASEGHSMAPKGGIVFGELKGDCKKMSYFKRYGQSKVALIAFTKQLASEYPQLKVAAIHPGRISTGMGRALARDSRLIRWGGILGKFTTTTIELGVLNHLYAAVSPDVQSGEYYVPVGIIDKKTIVEKDPTLVTRLKEWTDEELKGRY